MNHQFSQWETSFLSKPQDICGIKLAKRFPETSQVTRSNSSWKGCFFGCIKKLGGGNSTFFYFLPLPTWGNDQIGRIFQFKWVGEKPPTRKKKFGNSKWSKPKQRKQLTDAQLSSSRRQWGNQLLEILGGILKNHKVCAKWFVGFSDSLTRWWFKYFLEFSSRIPGEDGSNLTSIFFKWVGSTTN